MLKIFGDLEDVPTDLAEATEFWHSEIGLFVIPINVSSKKVPMIKWKIGSREPTLDTLIKKVRQGGGIGIRLPKYMVVVDLDVDSSLAPSDMDFRVGLNTLTELMVNSEPTVLETITVATPSGGHHLYYSSPIGATNAGMLGKGIDLRTGPSGMVLVPPSYGTNYRGRYEFDLSCSYLREMPSFLGKMLVSYKRQGRGSLPVGHYPPPVISEFTSSLGKAILEERCRRIIEAPRGTRNQTMYDQALVVYRAVGAGLISIDDADSNLLTASIRRSMVSGKGQDIDATLASAKNNGISKPYRKTQVAMFQKRFDLERRPTSAT